MSNSTTTAETILVVDDHEALCDLIEVILCRAGYRVFTALDGDEALQVARKNSEIDLLVSDMDMPGMCGTELAARFSTLHPKAAVAYIASTDRPKDLAASVEFVSKPFTIPIMRDAVRRALESRTNGAV